MRPAIAVEAGPAGDVVMQDHPVAFPEPPGGRLAGYGPGDLVAEDPGTGEQALLDLLDVRPADPAGVDADEHLGGADLGHRHVLDPEISRSPADRRLHE